MLLVPLVVAIVFHEVAHGWVARWLGDPTAQEQRRLSFNPLRHVAPGGTGLRPRGRGRAGGAGGQPAFWDVARRRGKGAAGQKYPGLDAGTAEVCWCARCVRPGMDGGVSPVRVLDPVNGAKHQAGPQQRAGGQRRSQFPVSVLKNWPARHVGCRGAGACGPGGA